MGQGPACEPQFKERVQSVIGSSGITAQAIGKNSCLLEGRRRSLEIGVGSGTPANGAPYPPKRSELLSIQISAVDRHHPGPSASHGLQPIHGRLPPLPGEGAPAAIHELGQGSVLAGQETPFFGMLSKVDRNAARWIPEGPAGIRLAHKERRMKG